MDITNSLKDMAVLYYRMNSYPQAEEKYLAALNTYQKVFGLEHPQVCSLIPPTFYPFPSPSVFAYCSSRETLY
jgi:hypothetical protein